MRTDAKFGFSSGVDEFVYTRRLGGCVGLWGGLGGWGWRGETWSMFGGLVVEWGLGREICCGFGG